MTNTDIAAGSEVVVREMRWWDIDSVHRIEESVFPETAWTTETFWAELARAPDSRAYFVATQPATVVGYAGVLCVGADADVQTIAVSSTHRHRGIADTLMRQLLQTAEERGASRVFLEVGADNNAAIALYRRWEFEVTANRADYYGLGRDAVVMRKMLRQGVPQ
jgi:ribosomal-protein-alanine N-acetyltransferase